MMITNGSRVFDPTTGLEGVVTRVRLTHTLSAAAPRALTPGAPAPLFQLPTAETITMADVTLEDGTHVQRKDKSLLELPAGLTDLELYDS
jgi:hypothetical protein